MIATFAGQRNRIFPVIFPVSREFGRSDLKERGFGEAILAHLDI
jgi:hypothetical protein